MPYFNSLNALAFAVMTATLLTACGGSSDNTPMPSTPSKNPTPVPTPNSQTMTLNFKALAGATPIACDGDIANLGTKATTAKLADLHFYVSNIQLLKSDGSSVPLTLTSDGKYFYHQDGVVPVNVAMIDLENNYGSCNNSANDKDMNSKITGTVPTGNYVGLSYDIGVPESVNHIDTSKAPAPLDHAGLSWNWQAGKKFLKVELKPATGVNRPATATSPATTATTYMLHLGSTGCVGNPVTGEATICSNPNRMPVKFANFNPNTQSIGVDILGLFKNSDISLDNGGAMGCMSGMNDPECGGLFDAMGLQLSTGLPATNANQSVFSPVNN
ncbi:MULTISPECIES: MbnP family copper-binding protein [unclassified Moraxella]|uniref:MbnP family copper-binding protein n=1 Tax=unclassified Moraxella TaxID=2685852 RepID=UPI003AF85793